MLLRATVDGRVGGSQHLVPGDDLVERALQDVDAHTSVEAANDCNVVRPRRGLDLIEQPEPLLRERQRNVIAAVARDDRAARVTHRSLRLELDAQRLQAPERARVLPPTDRLTGDSDGAEAFDDRRERELRNQAGEGRPEAMMGRPTERQVTIVDSTDVEPIRVGEPLPDRGSRRPSRR